MSTRASTVVEQCKWLDRMEQRAMDDDDDDDDTAPPPAVPPVAAALLRNPGRARKTSPLTPTVHRVDQNLVNRC